MFFELMDVCATLMTQQQVVYTQKKTRIRVGTADMATRVNAYTAAGFTINCRDDIASARECFYAEKVDGWEVAWDKPAGCVMYRHNEHSVTVKEASDARRSSLVLAAPNPSSRWSKFVVDADHDSKQARVCYRDTRLEEEDAKQASTPLLKHIRLCVTQSYGLLPTYLFTDQHHLSVW